MMKIKVATLRRVIREEYSRMINEGDDDAPRTVKQKLADAIAAETGHMMVAMLKAIQGLHNKGTINDREAVKEAKKLKLNADAKAALRG